MNSRFGIPEVGLGALLLTSCGPKMPGLEYPDLTRSGHRIAAALYESDQSDPANVEATQQTMSMLPPCQAPGVGIEERANGVTIYPDSQTPGSMENARKCATVSTDLLGLRACFSATSFLDGDGDGVRDHFVVVTDCSWN